MTPREYFDRYVEPAYADWRANTLSERHAKIAANEINNMADYMLTHFTQHEPSKVYGISKPDNAGLATYRRNLCLQECQDFQTVWDIADAHKHQALFRKSATVADTDKVSPVVSFVAGMFGAAPFGSFPFGGGGADVTALYVELLDGRKLLVSSLLDNAITMWRRLLVASGI